MTEKKDIRNEGSGNIGASNVFRIKGRLPGLFVLFLDMLKGALPMLYGLRHFESDVMLMYGAVAIILGHLFPVYLKFKGGKGIASFVGILLVFHFPSALAFIITFFLTLNLTRYVSAGSISGVIVSFFCILFTQTVEVAAIMFAVTLLIIVKHRSNIYRILQGTENKLFFKNHG
jgi:glycerol-3-phosphate acyltransferase PlsY